MELIIHKSLFSSNFYVDYEGYDIFELWSLSGNLYLLWIEIILARHSAREFGLGPWVSYPTLLEDYMIGNPMLMASVPVITIYSKCVPVFWCVPVFFHKQFVSLTLQ